MLSRDERGVALFMVIGVILLVSILSAIILGIASSHSRLTHHQVSRIQAQYAAKAGVLYALDKLRLRLPADAACWPPAGPFPYVRQMKSSGAGCDIIESGLPVSVSQVDITVYAPDSGVVPGTQKVSATAIYNTYTP
ncbi:MAG: hypothetical protein ABIH91_04470 [Candidatus Omnitrophota bacterium]